MLREMLDSLHEKKLAYGCRSVSRGGRNNPDFRPMGVGAFQEREEE